MNGTSPIPDAVDDVNALYGPGSIIGWYITLTATLISWLFHPRRASSDSIDPDFILWLTLPILAVGHLIVFATQVSSGRFLEHSVDAICAPKRLAVNGAMTSFFMSMAAGSSYCFKRLVSVVMVGVACLTTVLCSEYGLPKGRAFERLASKDRVIFGCTAGVFMYCLAPTLAWKMRQQIEHERNVSRTRSAGQRGLRIETQPPNPAEETGIESLHDEVSDPVERWVFTGGTVLAGTFAIGPALYDFKNVFPHTRSSIDDWDQLAAVLGGATVLVFNLYSVASYWYSRRRKKTRRTTDIEAAHSLEFSNIHIQYSSDPDQEQDLQADAGSGPS